MTVVLVPVSCEQLISLQKTTLAGPLVGYTVTSGLRDTFGLAVSDDEEADRTVLLLAGLKALMSYGRRLAIVIEKDVSDTGDPFGEVSVPAVSWQDLSAIFADAPEAAAVVSATAQAIEDLDLDSAWDTDQAQALMAEHDLLWYGPQEASSLICT